MIVIFGSDHYGKCDRVPGLFYVVTRFGHLYYVPLIPLQSYLVFEGTESGGGFRGVPLGLSGKSVLVAWSRVALFLAGLVLAVLAVVAGIRTLEAKGGLWTAGLLAGLAVLSFYLFGQTYRLVRAHPARALRLAQEAGLDPELVAQFMAGDLPPEEDQPPLALTPSEGQPPTEAKP